MRCRMSFYRGLIVALLLCCLLPAYYVEANSGRSISEYLPGEVIVKLKPSADIRKFAARFGLRDSSSSIDRLGPRSIYRMQIADGDTPKHKAAVLAQEPLVDYAEPNYQGQIPEARLRSSWVVGGDIHEYVAQWAPAMMRLPEAHAVSGGAGVTIAILDTGIDLSHPALAGRLVSGYDFVDMDSDPSEEGAYGQDNAFGHGTHVAGLVALAAPDAKIMPLRTLRPDGSGTIWMQAEALRYAIERGADVINLSYSYDQPSRLLDDVLAEVTCSAPGNKDCRSTTRPGAVVVAAAGNDGADSREYPAGTHAPGILAVGASTEADVLAAFSNYGSWVQVAAPGDRILSTIPGGGFATWSGTSMATPLTAGTIALLRAARPAMRPVEVVSRLTTTAATINSQVRRRVDAAAALGLGTTIP